MPRPGRGPRSHEKSKDFVGAMKVLISKLKPWAIPMIISCVLAFVSSICSVIAPNQLSKIADLISKSLVPGIDMDLISIKNILILLAFIYIWCSIPIYSIFINDKYI